MSRRDSPDASRDSSRQPARNYTDKSYTYRSHEGKGNDDGYASSSYAQDRRWRDQRQVFNDEPGGAYTPTHPRSRNEGTEQSFRNIDRGYVSGPYTDRGASRSSSSYASSHYSRQPRDYHSPPMRPRHDSPPLRHGSPPLRHDSPPLRPHSDSPPLHPHRDSSYRPHTPARDQRWAPSRETPPSRDAHPRDVYAARAIHPYREPHTGVESRSHTDTVRVSERFPSARAPAHSPARPATPGHAARLPSADHAARTPQRWPDAPRESRESRVHVAGMGDDVRARIVGARGVADQPARRDHHDYHDNRDNLDDRDERDGRDDRDSRDRREGPRDDRGPREHDVNRFRGRGWYRLGVRDGDGSDGGSGDTYSYRARVDDSGESVSEERGRDRAEGRADRASDAYAGEQVYRAADGPRMRASSTHANEEEEETTEPLTRFAGSASVDTRSYASVAALSTSPPVCASTPAAADTRSTATPSARKATPASLLQRLLGAHARTPAESSVGAPAVETMQTASQPTHTLPTPTPSLQSHLQPQAPVQQQSQQQRPQERGLVKTPAQVLGAPRPRIDVSTSESTTLPAASSVASPGSHPSTQPQPTPPAVAPATSPRATRTSPTAPDTSPTAPRVSSLAIPHARLTPASDRAPLAAPVTAPATSPTVSPAASLNLLPAAIVTSSSLSSTSSSPPSLSPSSSSMQLDRMPPRPATHTHTHTHPNANTNTSTNTHAQRVRPQVHVQLPPRTPTHTLIHAHTPTHAQPQPQPSPKPQQPQQPHPPHQPQQLQPQPRPPGSPESDSATQHPPPPAPTPAPTPILTTKPTPTPTPASVPASASASSVMPSRPLPVGPARPFAPPQAYTQPPPPTHAHAHPHAHPHTRPHGPAHPLPHGHGHTLPVPPHVPPHLRPHAPVHAPVHPAFSGPSPHARTPLIPPIHTRPPAHPHTHSYTHPHMQLPSQGPHRPPTAPGPHLAQTPTASPQGAPVLALVPTSSITPVPGPVSVPVPVPVPVHPAPSPGPTISLPTAPAPALSRGLLPSPVSHHAALQQPGMPTPTPPPAPTSMPTPAPALVPAPPSHPRPPLRASPLPSLLEASAASAPDAAPLSAPLLALIRSTGAHLPPGYIVERSLSLLPGGLRYAAERRVRRANELRRKQQKEQERREDHRRRRSTAKDVGSVAVGGHSSPRAASPRVQAGRASPAPQALPGAAPAPAPAPQERAQAQAQAQAQREAARLQRVEEHVEAEQRADAEGKRKRPSGPSTGAVGTTDGVEGATSDTSAFPRTAYGTSTAQWSTEDVTAAAARAHPDLFAVDTVKTPGKKNEIPDNESFTSFFWRSFRDPNVHLPLYRALFPRPCTNTVPPACPPLLHTSNTAPYDPLARDTLAAARMLVLDSARARYQALLALETALPVTLTATTTTSAISSIAASAATGSVGLDTAATMGVAPTASATDATLCATARSHAAWTAEGDAVDRDVRALHRTLPAQILRLVLGIEPGSRIVAAARTHEHALAHHLQRTLRPSASNATKPSSHVHTRPRVSTPSRPRRARQASLLQELRRQGAHTLLTSLLAASDVSPLAHAQTQALVSAEGAVSTTPSSSSSSSSLSSSSSSSSSSPAAPLPVAALFPSLAHTPLPGASRTHLLSRQLLAASLARMHLLARHIPAHTREALLQRAERLCGDIDALAGTAEAQTDVEEKREMLSTDACVEAEMTTVAGPGTGIPLLPQPQPQLVRPDALFLRILRARVKAGSGFSLGKDIPPGGSFPEMAETAVVAHHRNFRRVMGFPAPAQSRRSDQHDADLSVCSSRFATAAEALPGDTATHAHDNALLPFLPSSTGLPPAVARRTPSLTPSASAPGLPASTPLSVSSSLHRSISHTPASALARSTSAAHPPSPTHAALIPASSGMARPALTPLASSAATASPHASAPRTLRKHAFGHGLSAQHKPVAMDSLGKTRVARINPVSGASEYAEQRPLAQRGYASAVARDPAATRLAAVRVRLLARVYRRLARSYATAARGVLSDTRDKSPTSTANAHATAAMGLFGLSSPFTAVMHAALHGSLPCPVLPLHLSSAVAPSKPASTSSLPPLPPHSSSPTAAPTHGATAASEEPFARANTYCGPSLATLAALRDSAAEENAASAGDSTSTGSKRALLLQALFGADSPYAAVLQRVLAPAQLVTRMKAILCQSLHKRLRDAGVGTAALAPELLATPGTRSNTTQADVAVCSLSALPTLPARSTGDAVLRLTPRAPPSSRGSDMPATTTAVATPLSESADTSAPQVPVFSPGEYHDFPIPATVQSLARALPLNELFCSSMLPLAHVEAALASDQYRRAFPGLPPADPAWLQLNDMVRARMPTAALRVPAALRQQLAATLLGEHVGAHEASPAAEGMDTLSSASTRDAPSLPPSASAFAAASQTSMAADPTLQELAMAMVLALCHADDTEDTLALAKGAHDASSRAAKRSRPAYEEAIYVSSRAQAHAQAQVQVQGQEHVSLQPHMRMGGPSTSSTDVPTRPLSQPPKSSSPTSSARCQRLLRALCGYPHAFMQPRILPVQTRVFAPAASRAMHSLSFNRTLAFTMGKAFSEIDFSGMVAAYRHAHASEPLGTATDPIVLTNGGGDSGGDGDGVHGDGDRDGDREGSASSARELVRAVRWWLQTHQRFKRRDRRPLHPPTSYGSDYGNNDDSGCADALSDGDADGVGEGGSDFSLSVHTVRGALGLLADQLWPTARPGVHPAKAASDTAPTATPSPIATATAATAAVVTSAAAPGFLTLGPQRPPLLPMPAPTHTPHAAWTAASAHTPRTAAPSVPVVAPVDADTQRKRKREASATISTRASLGLALSPTLASLLLAPSDDTTPVPPAPVMSLTLLWRLLRAHPHFLLVLQRVQAALLRVTASRYTAVTAGAAASGTGVGGAAGRSGLSLRDAVRDELATMPALDTSDLDHVSDMTDTSASIAETLATSPSPRPPRILTTLTVAGPRGPVAVRVAQRNDGCLLVALSGADVADVAALERVAGVVRGQHIDSAEDFAVDAHVDTTTTPHASPRSGARVSTAPRVSCCCTLPATLSVAIPADQEEDEDGGIALAALSLAPPASPSAPASSAFAASLLALTEDLSPANATTMPCGCHIWSTRASDAHTLASPSAVSVAYRAADADAAPHAHGTLVYTHPQSSATHVAAARSFEALLLGFLPTTRSSAEMHASDDDQCAAGSKAVNTAVDGHGTTAPATATGPVFDVVPFAAPTPSPQPPAPTPATPASPPLPAPLQDLPWLRSYLSPTILCDLHRVHAWEMERRPRAQEAKRRNAQLLEQYQRGLRKFDRKYAHLRPEDRPRRKRLVLPVFFAHLTPAAALPAVSTYAAQWAAMVRQHAGARYSQLLRQARTRASTASQSNSMSVDTNSIAVTHTSVNRPSTSPKTVVPAETVSRDLHMSSNARNAPADALVRVEVCLLLSTGEFGCNIILCDAADTIATGSKAPGALTPRGASQVVGVMEHNRADTDRALLHAVDTQAQASSAAVSPVQYYAITVDAAGVTAIPETAILPRAQPIRSEAALDRVDLHGPTPDFAAYSDLADSATAAAFARVVMPATGADIAEVDSKPTPLATAAAHQRADAQLLAPLEPFGYTLPPIDLSTPAPTAGVSQSLPEADGSCLVACPDGTISAVASFLTTPPESSVASFLTTPLESSVARYSPDNTHGGAVEAASGEPIAWSGGVDPTGLEFSLDPDGNPYYVDAAGAVYYHDARGYPYYLCSNGDRMYGTNTEAEVVFYSPELDVWYTLDSQGQVLACNMALDTDYSMHPLPAGPAAASAASPAATTIPLASAHATPQPSASAATSQDASVEAQLLAEAWLVRARSTRAFADDEDAPDGDSVPEADATQPQVPLMCDLMASRPAMGADIEPSMPAASMFACSDTFESLAPDTLTVSAALLELLPAKAKKRVIDLASQRMDEDVDGASPQGSSPPLVRPHSLPATPSGLLPATTLTPSSRNPLHTHTHTHGATGSSDRDTPLKPQVSLSSHASTTSTELSASLSEGLLGDTAPVVIPSRAQVAGLTSAQCSVMDPLETAQMSLAELALVKLHTTFKTNLRRVHANVWNAVSITTSLDCQETAEM